MIVPNPYTLPTVEFVGGSTQEFVFNTYSAIAHKPFDLSSCTANFSVISYVNRDGRPLISKAMTIEADDSFGSENQTTNILRVTLTPSDTAGLVGKFIYQISIRYVSGEMDIPNQGLMYITRNINPGFAVE